MKQRRYNILFLGFVPFIGGAEMSTLLLLKYLNRERFNPTCIIPAEGPLYARLADLGVKVVTMPLELIKLPFPLDYIRTVWRLTRFIRRNKIDLVICTFEICNQYGLPAARLNRIPIACHTRNLIPDPRSFWRTFLHFPDILIANSKATAESYSRFVRNGQKVEVVHNGVDLDEYSPSICGDAVRRRYGIDDDKFLIGMVARISRPKGQACFIRAISEVAKVCPNVSALIVGDTRINRSEQYLEELKRMVEELGLSGNVVFTGFVNEMRELYAALDLLVLASEAEPFGRVLIEAMAMEKPVVATRAGGAVEIVEDGLTGLLVPPDDVDGLAKAVIRILEKGSERRRMGKAGRRRAAELFSIKKNVEETQKIYIEVLR